MQIIAALIYTSKDEIVLPERELLEATLFTRYLSMMVKVDSPCRRQRIIIVCL